MPSTYARSSTPSFLARVDKGLPIGKLAAGAAVLVLVAAEVSDAQGMLRALQMPMTSTTRHGGPPLSAWGRRRQSEKIADDCPMGLLTTSRRHC